MENSSFDLCHACYKMLTISRVTRVNFNSLFISSYFICLSLYLSHPRIEISYLEVRIRVISSRGSHLTKTPVYVLTERGHHEAEDRQ